VTAQGAKVQPMARRPNTASDHRQRILRVQVHLQQNLDAPLNVEQLAQVAALSPFHFHRVFRGIVGESVMDHVRRLRLERAAGRLRFSDAPVVEVALEAAYESHEAFTRAFRAQFSLSPSAFRNRATRTRSMPAPGALPTRAARLLAHVRRRPAVRVAFRRHVGPYDQVGEAWRQLFGWARSRALIINSASTFGLSYDDPEITPAEHVRYDACLEVDDSVKPDGEMAIQEVPGGSFAVAVHVGPYSSLDETYTAVLCGWAAATRREFGPAPSLERYLNDPRSTPPDQVQTEIWLRLADDPQPG
jgi:AraC family transcriptional regulator